MKTKSNKNDENIIHTVERNMGIHRRHVSSHSSDRQEVAIIGAGFAGLVLANYLEQHTTTHTTLVLESRNEPIPIIGTFRLPKLITKSLFSEIGIHVGKDTEDEEIFVSRQDLLAKLRKNISIQYSCHVTQVYTKNEKLYLSAKNKSTELLGPFDIVVAANGLSLNRGQQLLFSPSVAACANTAIIGDSRWYHTVWWDLFGFTRIKMGGAIAMMDGLELGERLVHGKPLQEYAVQERPRRKVVGFRMALIAFLVLTYIAVASMS